MTDVKCVAELDLLTGDGIKETSLRYALTLFSNRDLNVSCEARLGSAEWSAGGYYYVAQQRGAVSGGCGAGVNYPPTDDIIAGEWYYEIIKGQGPIATYGDEASHPLNGTEYRFVENDCAVFVAQDDGAWIDAALSDVF